MTFTTQHKIRFAHVDPAGIVFFPRYLEMLNAVMEDWFEECIGADFANMHLERGIGGPVVRIEADFLLPSRLGETVEASLIVERLGKSSCTFRITFHCGEETRIIFHMVIVCMDLKHAKATPWPDDLRVKMEAYMAETGA
jgi:4-hydroxybenzoyl-CoA thioesterase